MSKTCLIRLEEDDLGQLLGGLKAREDCWRRTADYLRSGCSGEFSNASEECSDESEADRMAEWYAKLIRAIERQRDEQRG